jgi:hypothetical protein
MNALLDHLGELTGQRDRDVLDATLAKVVNDLLRPRVVGVYRVAGDESAQRWVDARSDQRGGTRPAAADRHP